MPPTGSSSTTIWKRRSTTRCAAGDTDRAARILETIALPAACNGRSATAAGWLRSFDDARLLERYPAVALLGARVYALRGDTAAAERWLAAAERIGRSRARAAARGPARGDVPRRRRDDALRRALGGVGPRRRRRVAGTGPARLRGGEHDARRQRARRRAAGGSRHECASAVGSGRPRSSRRASAC